MRENLGLARLLGWHGHDHGVCLFQFREVRDVFGRVTDPSPRLRPGWGQVGGRIGLTSYRIDIWFHLKSVPVLPRRFFRFLHVAEVFEQLPAGRADRSASLRLTK